MKKILIAAFLLSSSFAFAKDITLNHRVLNNCDNDSCYYDFFNMTQEYGYGLSLQFGNSYEEDVFGTVQVVDEVGLIVDLGKISCKDIENSYEDQGEGYPTSQDRKKDPMFWLMYSEAWTKLQDGGAASSLNAQEGHCYLMYKTSTHQQVIVAFHVKELIKNVSVTLNEIEVFKKATIK